MAVRSHILRDEAGASKGKIDKCWSVIHYLLCLGRKMLNPNSKDPARLASISHVPSKAMNGQSTSGDTQLLV